MAAMVKTRTVVQTRTHAQKYFQKVAKGMGEDDYFDEFEPASTSSQKKKTAKKSVNNSSQKKKYAQYSDDESEDDEELHEEGEGTSEENPPSHFSVSNGSSQLQTPISIFIPKNISGSFPQPSPAACGRRKEAEMAAAEILASTSSQDAEGAQVLSMIKEAEYRPGEIVRKRKIGLSIINPEEMRDASTWGSEPSTPWEREVKALEKKTPAAISGTLRTPQHIPTISLTPTDHKAMLARLYHAVKKANLNEVKSALRVFDESFGRPRSSSISTPMSPPGSVLMNRSDSFESTESGSDMSATKVKSADATDQWGAAISRVLNSSDVIRENVLFVACALTPEECGQQTVVDICRVLIDHGANAFLVDKKIGSCLHLVANNGYTTVARLLLNRGCKVNDVDENGDTAMHLAARKQHSHFLELLVNFGANCHARNIQGRAALDVLEDITDGSVESAARRAELRRILLSIEPRLRTLILYHDDCLEHTPRKLSDWEGPDRLKNIMQQLNDLSSFPEYELEFSTEFEKAPVELLSRVHSPEYITFVDNLSKQLQQKSGNDQPVPFTPQLQRILLRQSSEETKNGEYSDTAFSAGTLTAARRAAGAVSHAVDRILLGRNRNAFCVVRPPGHHAGYNGLLDGGRSCGFCIFNSVAAGALHALEAHRCERVAIVDLDIHHGNGTEDIVRRYQHPSRLFFYSVHLFDKSPSYEFFPGTGARDDPAHNIVNVPLMPIWGQECSSPDSIENIYGRESYRKAVSERLLPALRAFNPSLIIISTGFDGGYEDVGNTRVVGQNRQRGMDMRPEDFAWVTSEILKIADICCNGRVVSVLEGGYGNYSPKSRKTRAVSARTSTSFGSSSNAADSDLNRKSLAISAAAHVRRLVDPYGYIFTFFKFEIYCCVIHSKSIPVIYINNI